MKPIHLTLHAEAKMSEREIEIGWVIETARSPDWIEPEPHDPVLDRRFRSIAGFGGRILRVVCCETDVEIRIVTATFDTGAKRP